MQRIQTVLLQCAGWLLYMSLLMLIALALPADIFDSQSKHFIFLVGAVGIWRYSMGATHFIRGMIFLYGVYPYLRRKVQKASAEDFPLTCVHGEGYVVLA